MISEKQTKALYELIRQLNGTYLPDDNDPISQEEGTRRKKIIQDVAGKVIREQDGAGASILIGNWFEKGTDEMIKDYEKYTRI